MTIDVKFQDGSREIYNSFEEIIYLEDYDDIVFIDCYENQLTELPILPLSLKSLICSNNQLTNLPTLSDNLKKLWCSDNKLTELPILPDSLSQLYCKSNQLTELPTLPGSLKGITYYNNPIHDFIDRNFNGNLDEYQEWKQNCLKKFVRKIEDAFLKCKYNPKYAYCRRVVCQSKL